jgi:hypothetical protein
MALYRIASNWDAWGRLICFIPVSEPSLHVQKVAAVSMNKQIITLHIHCEVLELLPLCT